MKRFYSDYVRHCIRFYIKYPNCIHMDSTNIDNWTACDKAFSAFSENDKSLFRDIYTDGKNTEYIMLKYSKDNGIALEDLQKKCSTLERMIARIRGLI